MFCLAARTEGKNPPKNPIIIAKMIAEIAIDGERAKENDSSEND